MVIQQKEDKLLNLSEAAKFLELSEENLQRLAEEGKVSAYKIGGVFLRFKPEHLHLIKPQIKNAIESLSLDIPKQKTAFENEKISFLEKIREFWHFYDFYVATFILTGCLLYVIINYSMK